MTIQDADLLAAISGGIEQATPEEVRNEPDASGENDGTDAGASTSIDADDAGSNDGEADASAEDESAASAESGDSEESGDSGDEGEESAESDEQKAAKASEAPLTKEQQRAKDEAENAEAAKKDPINAPVSPYLKPATQERMRSLIDIAKTTTQERDRALQDRNDIIQMVQDTGASAQQYSTMLGYLQAVNSGDPANLRAAAQYLRNELEHISRMGGFAVPGVNAYDSHADLKAAVAANQIPVELANEIAARRNQETFQTQSRDQAQQAQQRAQQEQQQAYTEGKAALNEIGRTLAARDGAEYQKKAAAVLQKIGPALKAAQPSKWATMFLTEYSAYKAPAPVVQKPKVPKNQPLRGNNPSGGQQGAPKSLADAINLGIARATRG